MKTAKTKPSYFSTADPWSFHHRRVRKDRGATGRPTGGFTGGMGRNYARLWRRALRPYVGDSWLDLPFYFAEALFYLRILLAALGEDRDPALSAAGKVLSSSLQQERLVIHEHSFWNGPLHYPELPRKIVRKPRRSDSRTLLEEVASYFPAPFAVLRTMKNDAVVDLQQERVGALDREDSERRINGERGMIRVVERHASWN